MGSANFGCGSMLAASVVAARGIGGTGGISSSDAMKKLDDEIGRTVKAIFALLFSLVVILCSIIVLANLNESWGTRTPVTSKITVTIDRQYRHSKSGIVDVEWTASTEADPDAQIQVSSRDMPGDVISYKRITGYFTGTTVGCRR